MEASVLGRRLSEKAEHLPIKKRRFLFRDSSPPPSSEGTENVAALPHSSDQEVPQKPNANCPPAASSTVADLHQSSSIDSKVDGEKFVKASTKACENEDSCGTSLLNQTVSNNNIVDNADREGSGIVSHDTKNLEPGGTVEYKANWVKSENMSVNETDVHIPIAHSKAVDSCTMDRPSLDKATVDEPTLNKSCSHVPSESECSMMNKVASKTQSSAELDDRLNWDLNTVMTAWEEPLECEGKTSNREGFEQEKKCGSATENIENEGLPAELKSLTPKIEKSEQEELKPSIKLLSPVSYSAPHVAVNAFKSSHYQHINSSSDSVPVPVPVPGSSILTLKYPACEVSTKHVNVGNKGTDDLSHPMAAAGTGFSLDYNIPPGFDPCKNRLASEKNMVSSKNVNHAISTVQTTETDKLNLSLVTTGSLEKGVTFDEDDKSKVKRVITYSRITMEKLIGKGTESSRNVFSSKFVGSGNSADHGITSVKTNENEQLNLSLVTAASPETRVHQNGSTFDEDDKAKVKRVITSNGISTENLISKGIENSDSNHKRDCKEVNQTTIDSLQDLPATVSSKHDVKAGKTPVTCHISHESHTKFPNDVVNYSKEVYDNENFPSDIQARSEVDNVDRFSYGYDSQFEDGEFRGSIIQTWEGCKGDVREIENGKENKVAFGTHENESVSAPETSSRIRSTDVGSQKGADEISSVLVPEKLESSDRVSGSEPNETGNGTTEINMKDASKSDQWKMNVSGSDILPENHSSTSNVSNIKDLSSIKFSSRIGRYGPETEDLETKVEGSRFYRREPPSCVGDPSSRDAFLTRGRFRMQGSSSNNADDSPSRSIRDSGVLRSSIRRGPHIPANGRGGGTWNRSPPFPGPSLRRSLHEDTASDDNLTNEISIDPNVTRQSFRNRLPSNREEDEFRARLGLRPSGDTCHNRFVNVGRGRSLRYGSRHNGGGPRGRYYGPANDDYDEVEYSHSFPARRRCFSGSISPQRSRPRSPINDGFRRRSRSPNLRIRRLRSPDYGHGFEPNLEPRNNNSPPSSRWVKYKPRSTNFDRRSPPPIGERLSFYDSSRKTKQSETYRSGPPGRFPELHGTGRGGPGPRYVGNDGELPDNGYRRGGFVRRYDMGRPVKHIQYDEEDGYGPVYDSHGCGNGNGNGNGNPKAYSNGTESRFRDLPRRP